jgi:citrate synthase
MFNLPSFIFAAVMGLWMSLTITLATTLFRIGLTSGWVSQWLELWFVAYPVAIFCIMLYRPAAMKVTAYLVSKLARTR